MQKDTAELEEQIARWTRGGPAHRARGTADAPGAGADALASQLVQRAALDRGPAGDARRAAHPAGADARGDAQRRTAARRAARHPGGRQPALDQERQELEQAGASSWTASGSCTPTERQQFVERSAIMETAVRQLRQAQERLAAEEHGSHRRPRSWTQARSRSPSRKACCRAGWRSCRERRSGWKRNGRRCASARSCCQGRAGPRGAPGAAPPPRRGTARPPESARRTGRGTTSTPVAELDEAAGTRTRQETPRPPSRLAALQDELDDARRAGAAAGRAGRAAGDATAAGRAARRRDRARCTRSRRASAQEQQQRWSGRPGAGRLRALRARGGRAASRSSPSWSCGPAPAWSGSATPASSSATTSPRSTPTPASARTTWSGCAAGCRPTSSGCSSRSRRCGASQDEHRLAVAAFRQQLIDWQGQIAEMKRAAGPATRRGWSASRPRWTSRPAQVDATSERLAQQAEELQEQQREVAERRAARWTATSATCASGTAASCASWPASR